MGDVLFTPSPRGYPRIARHGPAGDGAIGERGMREPGGQYGLYPLREHYGVMAYCSDAGTWTSMAAEIARMSADLHGNLLRGR